MPTGTNPSETGEGENSSAPQLDEAAIGNIVNQAVTAQLKRALPKALESALSEALKPVTEKLTALEKPDPETEKSKAKQNPEYLALEKRLEESETRWKKAEDERQAAIQKGRQDKAYADLKTGLQQSGIRPEFIDFVADALTHRGRVTFDDEGNALFKTGRNTVYGEEELLPLTQGVESYAKSKEADAFRPAPTPNAAPPMRRANQAPAGNGNGARIPQYDSPATTEQEKVRRAMEREDAISASLGLKKT